ncbi:hypothetical protein CRV08_06085 [Halarcobacter ebronensis]|uniref:UDP-N-acetylglucosamine 2-epimerase domain-containing protein n=1 Tax=Halarcobacter ebronensis TaxID=1462615 RepID=A0A4V1LRQ3_9BACT|nr:hypothetical protein [Halarcobacter ebronensis]RXJ68998.1 hypothetical protein CRV08_06085 [Halarcobacter ebronensis]
MKRVLILVDNSRRDLLPSELLKVKFEQNGTIVDFCNKRNYKIKIREFCPDAFLVSRGDLPFLAQISRVCKVYVVPAEGARLTPETMKSVFLGRIHNGKQLDQTGEVIEGFDHISKVYLWGDRTRRFLLSTEMFKEEQLKVAGNGRLDVYRKNEQKKMHNDFTIGIAFSIKSLSSFEGNVNYLKIIHGFFDEAKSGRFPMVPEGRHYEDYVWRDFAIARQMLAVILTIMSTTNYKIRFRVGPFENINDYKFLHELYPDRIFIQDQSEQLIDFLEQIDLMLTCWSSTGLESVLMNVPVIAIPYLIEKEHLFAHIAPEANGFDTFLRIYYTPESIEEVMKLIEQQKSKQLPLVPDIEFYNEFLRDIYNWPTQVSTTTFIVDDVLKDLENTQTMADIKTMKFSPKIEKILSLIPLPDRYSVKFLRVLNDIKFFIADIKSGKYISSKMHHELSNSEVSKLVESVKNYL